MNTKLKAQIEEAIDKVIQDNAENDLWPHYIHSELATQMTSAAEQVFDAAQTAQEFAKREE